MGNETTVTDREAPLTNAKWLFFDLGDTLVDNMRTWLSMLEELRLVLAEMGRRHSLDELMALFEQVSAEYPRNAFSEVQGRLGLNESQQEFAEARTHWRHDLEEIIPGACELLLAAAARYKLGVIANQAPGSEERCARMGIRSCFSVFVASAEFGAGKPSPTIFQAALDMAQCPPELAVMIGDRIDNDIRPAKMLGMKTIRLVRGCQRLQQPRDEWDAADFTVHSLEEMRALLDC